MRTKIMFGLLAVLGTGTAWAQGQEYCPATDAISQVGATYSAPTADGEGQWYGVAAAGAGQVQAFTEGVFRAHETSSKGVVHGEILRCSYTLQGGSSLDMRFKQPGTLVSIDDTQGWEQWHTQYFCENPEATACRFTELKRPARG
ncbi:MAG: DUF3757 domain-containing protein [Pseudomonas sp.]|uniref:DUF3757 domain-containing protein n=1 Tax=Pseudomonas abieticivorans TaxID=2931382 RepID=UPI0020BFBA3E|nr:DUF3757 domain-containing protein [Pseudomonas sp. PIA16]MDE1165151.1 DUF3757 domain-containing protein [Pseudomonas sp.]